MIRTATPAEIATTSHLPVHKQIVEVEINNDGRAVVGKAKTVHAAVVWTYLNVYGDPIGSTTSVSCGAERYRNARSAATKVSNRYAVDCNKCQ
jgi:hypothetical protein